MQGATPKTRRMLSRTWRMDAFFVAICVIAVAGFLFAITQQPHTEIAAEELSVALAQDRLTLSHRPEPAEQDMTITDGPTYFSAFQPAECRGAYFYPYPEKVDEDLIVWRNVERTMCIGMAYCDAVRFLCGEAEYAVPKDELLAWLEGRASRQRKGNAE